MNESQGAKLAVVTGATDGIGRALAVGLAEAGLRVAACGRDPARLATLGTALQAPHRVDRVDVAVRADVDRWADRLLASFGPPDLLVNNAAIINPTAPLWQLEAADTDRLFDVNVKGMVAVLQAFLPAMVARRRGVIVNLSSGWGRSVSPGVATYCASKWAVEGLTQALALELPAGMAAVPLNPGVIHTAMLESCFGDSAASYPSPDDWARRAVPFVLALGAADNGRPHTVPGVPTD